MKTEILRHPFVLRTMSVCWWCASSLLSIAQQPGDLDPSFDPGSGPMPLYFNSASSLMLQNDGKVIVAGAFTNLNGAAMNLARLNPDGSRDTNFISAEAADNLIVT